MKIQVGNKCDLEEQRVVPKSEGEDLAGMYKCPFFETSAKDHVNVDECFRELVREVRKHKEMKEAKTSPAAANGGGQPGGAAKPKKGLCTLL